MIVELGLLVACQVDYAAIDRFVESELESNLVPNAAIAIVEDGKIVHARGFGGADDHTPFVIGSLSKSFTAVLIMQLVEQGLVELDRPASTYLPWFRVASGAKITVRQLLDQSSGLERTAPRDESDSPSLEGHVRALASAKLQHAPGARHSYASPNYLVLGAIAEAVTGEPFAKLVRARVFGPLGMKNSHAERPDDLAPGHRIWFGWPVEHVRRHETDRLPTGALIASAADLGKYLIAHLEDGGTVLTSTSVAELHRPSARSKSFDYAMGWRVSKTAGVDSLWHGGAVPNYRGALVMLPESGWGIVVLTGVSSMLADHTRPIATAIAAMVTGQKPKKTRRTLRRAHFLLAVAALFAVLGSARSLWTIDAWLEKNRGRSSSVIVISEVGIAGAVLVGLPAFMDLSYADMYASAPDATVTLVIWLILSLVAGVLRVLGHRSA